MILEASISSTVIHIPKEYPPGSCEYQIILEHERGHGRSAREQAVDLAGKPSVVRRPPRASPRADPVIAASFDEAAGRFKAAIAKVVDPVYEHR